MKCAKQYGKNREPTFGQFLHVFLNIHKSTARIIVRMRCTHRQRQHAQVASSPILYAPQKATMAYCSHYSTSISLSTTQIKRQLIPRPRADARVEKSTKKCIFQQNARIVPRSSNETRFPIIAVKFSIKNHIPIRKSRFSDCNRLSHE